MSDNFNTNIDPKQIDEAGGLNPDNPAMTYVDFANKMASNAQTQQEHTELIKQAQLLSKQKQGASDMGINPETKGYLSKDEAMSLIQAELVRQKLMTDEVKAQLDAWYAAAPQMVEQQTVKDFISRYQPKEPKAGVPFVATAEDAKDKDKTDENDKPLIEGQTYSAMTDSEGNVTYVRGGQEKTTKGDGITPQQTEAAWRALDGKMYDVFKVGRGTALTQALMRADRGLNYVSNHDYLSKQGQTYVQQDLTGIFQGGVPTQEEMKDTDFGTYAQKINAMIERWTGIIGAIKWGNATAAQKSEVRNELMGTLMDMRSTITNQLTAMANAKTAGYEEIINANPDRWKRMLKGYEEIGNSSLNSKAKAEMESMTPKEPVAPAEGAPDVHALAAALGLKKKAQ